MSERYQLIIRRGATVSKTFRLKNKQTKQPINISGWSAELSLQLGEDEPILCNAANQKLTIPTGTDGAIKLLLQFAETANYEFRTDGKFYLLVTNSAGKFHKLSGDVSVIDLYD